MVASQTNLSAKKGKSNLYTSSITSIPFTGALTLEKVFLEKSTIEKEAPRVIKKPITIAIFAPLSILKINDFLKKCHFKKIDNFSYQKIVQFVYEIGKI